MKGVFLIVLLLLVSCAFEENKTRKVILDILQSSLAHENFFVRSAAAKAIGEMGDSKYIPLLIPMLKDPMAFVRLFTAESIAQLHGTDTLKLLLAAGGDPDPMVRIAVVKALDELAKDTGKVDALPIEKILAPFTKDSDATVLLFAKAALAKRGNEKMFMEIQNALETEETLSPAVVALGRTKLARAIPMLTKTLQNPDSTVRMFSAEALGEIASPAGLVAPDAFTILSALTKDTDAGVRGAAATSLGKIGDKKAMPILEALLGDPDMRVQISAAEGFARYGKVHLDIYEKAFQHDDYAVRHFAIGSLQKIAKKEAMPLFIKALSDPAQRVRIAAVRAIGAISGPEAIPILKGQLNDPDLSVRAYAAGNLGRWVR